MNSAKSPHQLSFGTVGGLKVRWFVPTQGGVSATPTVEPGGVYVVSQDGTISKLDPDTGTVLWSFPLSTYMPAHKVGSSTTSPAIASDRIVLGINAYVVALDKMTGSLIWRTLLDPALRSAVHAAPIIVDNRVFTGVMSSEETFGKYEAGFVPSFRGSAAALDLTTGALLWQTYTVPPGYTGGSIWGSSPAADPSRGLVYMTTGNNFTVPPAVGACITAAGSDISAQRACLDPSDYVDSFLALNMATGAVIWSRATIGADVWQPDAACDAAAAGTCPPIAAQRDVDFAQGPDLFWANNFVGVQDDRGGISASWVIGAGQKSGVYWALNPVNGGVFWSTRILQTCCGIQWGHAVDTSHNMLYVPLNNNSETSANTLVGHYGVPVKNWLGGAWTGIDTRTGKIQFQVPAIGQALDNPAVPGNTPGGLSVANGIAFGGTTSGYMVALGPNGAIHWRYYAGAVIAGAPAVFNNRLYWGAGNYSPAVAGQKHGVYCFSFE